MAADNEPPPLSPATSDHLEFTSEEQEAFEHLAVALQQLEKQHLITHDEAEGIGQAYLYRKRKIKLDRGTLDSANFKIGQKIIELLDRIEFFGDKEKPLDYTSNRWTLILNAMTIGTPALFLAVCAALFSLLKENEARPEIKKCWSGSRIVSSDCRS